MNSGLYRTAEANATQRNAVPKAPPLPAPRPFPGVIRNAAYKIIGLPPRSSSPQATRAEIKAALGTLNRFAALGATQDATAGHRTGLEINTLAINQQGTHALIGGKEIFKTVKIENGVCIEDRNLRTTIRSTPTQASGEVRKVYSIDIADVAWAKSDYGDYVAAATTSGKIILYNLGHASLQGTLLHEHARQVHKVTFNPHRGNLLLSGSQDGTVKLWDIREARTYASTLQSKSKFSGAGDGVRDVKWSPTDGVDFAFSTDSGWIQRWDIRNLKIPKIRIPAHQSICTSIDWHPDGKHLASAGMDKVLRIWDFSTSRKHKPAWEVRTPFPISNARWRPACESYMPEDNCDRMCTQIVTAYDRDHPVVHIWDLRRTALPFRELQPHATAPTDLLWHSQDLLWTVGREGVFFQSDIHHTTKVIDRRNLQAVAIATSGETAFASQRRHQRRATRHASLPQLQTPKPASLSQSPEYSLLSRSWADDSLDHSFLTVQARRTSQSRNSTRYSSATATPPSGPLSQTVIKLDDVLLHRQSFTPRQSAFHGANPLQIEPSSFKTMAKSYDIALNSMSQSMTLPEHVQALFAQHTHSARAQGWHQLAQTWDIVAFATSRHLNRRLGALVTSTADGSKSERTQNLRNAIQAVLRKSGSLASSPTFSPLSMRPVSSIAQALASTENNSNATTPLVRPTPNGKHVIVSNLHALLPDPDTDQDMAPLPPSLTSEHVDVGRFDLAVEESRPSEIQLTSENLQAMQAQRTTPMPIDDRRIHIWAESPQRTEREGKKAPVRPSMLKHDSDESFSFLVGSASSRDTSKPTSDEGSEDGRASMVKEHLGGPLLRVTSEYSRPIGSVMESYGVELPNFVSSPHASESIHRSNVGDDSALQTVPESVTIDKHEPVNPEILDMRTSAWLDAEAGEAFKLSEMLRELGHYYTHNAPSAQTAAQMLLMLVPLLPADVQPRQDQDSIEDMIASYVDSMSSTADVADVLEKTFGHIINAGLNPLQIESVLSSYHEQLLANRSYIEAASLRRLAYPAFPAVYECGLGDDSLVLTCGSCRKRVSMINGQVQCASCFTKQAPCAVCFSNSSPFQKSMGGNLITACLLCNHNLHADCAGEWFERLGGHGCPTEGCLCNCVA